MRAHEFPTFKEFLQENKAVITQQAPWLLIFSFLSVFTWLHEQPNTFRLYGFVPIHWFAEWALFAQAGKFCACMKRTIIPTELYVLAFCLTAMFMVAFIFDFAVTSFAFGALFTSPFPAAYCLEKIFQWTKNRSARLQS